MCIYVPLVPTYQIDRKHSYRVIPSYYKHVDTETVGDVIFIDICVTHDIMWSHQMQVTAKKSCLHFLFFK